MPILNGKFARKQASHRAYQLILHFWTPARKVALEKFKVYHHGFMYA